MLQPIFLYGRHGTTEGNKDGKYRGWSNSENAQLAAQGVDDAREAGDWIMRSGLPKIDLIICDDLDRVKNTALIIAGITGAKIETDQGLRPLNVGDFTGKSKVDNPLDEYMKDKSKKIPGGESLNHFNGRQAKKFDQFIERGEKEKKFFLILGHGSNASFLHTSFNGGEVGYEGVVNPGGLAVMTKEGIIPVFKSRMTARNPLADGTALSGFVTVQENRPPRECWNCRYYSHDPQGTGYCNNLVVRIDPETQFRKRTDGGIDVGDRECCNYFRNKIGT